MKPTCPKVCVSIEHNAAFGNHIFKSKKKYINYYELKLINQKYTFHNQCKRNDHGKKQVSTNV